MRMRLDQVWQTVLDARRRTAASQATTQNYLYHWQQFLGWAGRTDDAVSSVTPTRAADYARWFSIYQQAYPATRPVSHALFEEFSG